MSRIRNNLKTFNLGSSSQTPIQTKMLLDEHLDRLNPKLVVFEVYPVVFQLEGVESALDFIANTEFNSRTRHPERCFRDEGFC